MRQARDNLNDLLKVFQHELGINIKRKFYREYKTLAGGEKPEVNDSAVTDKTEGASGREISEGANVEGLTVNVKEVKEDLHMEMRNVVPHVRTSEEGETLSVADCSQDGINKGQKKVMKTELKSIVLKEGGAAVQDSVDVPTVDVNALMARILFVCYSSNLARYTGHQETGLTK